MGNSQNDPQNGPPSQPVERQRPQQQPQQQEGGIFEVLRHVKAEDQKYNLKIAQEKAKSAGKLAEIDCQHKQLDQQLLKAELQHQEQLAEIPHRQVLQANKQILDLMQAAKDQGKSPEEISKLVQLFTAQTSRLSGHSYHQQNQHQLPN